ncbi:hypothetical protein ACQVQY_13725 [Bacillus mycoides]|uniref:hypothetical protein n=1 Tax=Bacillus mycoides TaxID=1405 RepID=UPI003D64CED6
MDKETAIEYLKSIDEHEFVEIAQEVASHHLGDRWLDQDIKGEYGPSAEKSLLMIVWTKSF